MGFFDAELGAWVMPLKSCPVKLNGLFTIVRSSGGAPVPSTLPVWASEFL